MTSKQILSIPAFTPTEISILEVLSDGESHSRYEVLDCLDEYTCMTTLRVHISNMRKKLRPQGHEIVCEIVNRGTHYRHIRLLNPDII